MPLVCGANFGLSRYRMHVLSRPAAALYRCLPFLALFAACLPSQAQVPPSLAGLEQQARFTEQARQQATERILAAGGVPLEGAIDPTTYIVGPGDVFSIATGGAIPQLFAPTVSADGILVLPSVGSFAVAGLSLAEARNRVGAALQRAFRNVPTDVALSQPRQFYVHVSGEVKRPGRHVAVPVARVEDALAAAMEGGNPLQTLDELRQTPWVRTALPALRNVTVERQDGERILVDLLRYYATGDTRYNPYLRDGDRLYVPTFSSDGDAVFVEYPSRELVDRVIVNGTTQTVPRTTSQAKTKVYDFRPDDTVTGLLLVAGGPELLAKTPTVQLLRNAGGTLESSTVDIAAIVAGATPDRPLEARDRILLPDPGLRSGVAEADGFVGHPGTYPIVTGETTLPDLVAAAGGLRPDGLLRAAYLERRGSLNAPERGLALDAVSNPETRADFVEEQIFEQARLTDLPFGSRQYLTRELLQFQRVSLELGDDVASIPAIPLRDGDRFVVPRDPGAVLVVGQIRNPGYVPYEAGADAAYYIAQAGGVGPAAAEVYLREVGTGALRTPENAMIRSGDALFVDREPIADTGALQALTLQERQIDIQRESAAVNRRGQYIQAGLAVLSTAVGVLTTYLFTRNN